LIERYAGRSRPLIRCGRHEDRAKGNHFDLVEYIVHDLGAEFGPCVWRPRQAARPRWHDDAGVTLRSADGEAQPIGERWLDRGEFVFSYRPAYKDTSAAA